MDALRVHVAALSTQPEVFHVNEARVAAACARHPETAKHLRFDWSWDLDGFEQGIRDADAMIGWRFPAAELATLAPKLRLIQLTGAGCEHLQPLTWLPRGMTLTNNSGAHAPKAGEFIGAALLALNHGFAHFGTAQREHHFDKRFTTVIEGQTLLVLGVGALGGAAATWAKRRLKMRVLGIRRSGRPHRDVDEMHGLEALHSLLPRADFLLVTAPLTPETEGLLGARELDLLPAAACVVNMGRARIVDYAALRERLAGGRLRGALLDVFDPEPLPADSPLWDTPELLITPHCSSDDAVHYIDRTLDCFFDNAARLLAGKRLKNRVSASRGY